MEITAKFGPKTKKNENKSIFKDRNLNNNENK